MLESVIQAIRSWRHFGRLLAHQQRRWKRVTVEAVRTHVTNPLLRRETAHFLHIRKTGGSAIWHALVNKASRDFDVRMHRHSATLKDINEGVVFFFVRDPISRFQSGFYDRLRCGRPKYDKPWSEAERESFERFPTPNALAATLYGPDHDAAVEAIHSIEHVASSYWDWFIDDEYLRSRSDDILFVGRQERLTADFAELCRLLRLNSHLPDDPITAHRNPHGVEPLDPEARQNLQRWLSPEYGFMRTVAQLLQD